MIKENITIFLDCYFMGHIRRFVPIKNKFSPSIGQTASLQHEQSRKCHGETSCLVPEFTDKRPGVQCKK